ncbi:MAG: hypothetical protein RL674_1935, partial [Pseudomonadota bacterium]
MKKIITTLAVIGAMSSVSAFADCTSLPNQADLTSALKAAIVNSGVVNGGFGLNMWGTIVDRDGVVCAVAMTGADRGAQWPGSRVISAQKANTANAFSLPELPLSTANLYAATQPGGSLFGLQESNPVDTAVAYAGASENYGTAKDPLVGKKIGGINVFGGGLAMYKEGKLLGAIGVSGDSSCADHNIAWSTRKTLGYNVTPAGVGPNKTDGIAYTTSSAVKGWQHPV